MKDLMNVLAVTVWVIFFFILLNFGLDCINQPSNIANITGFVLIVFNVYITIKTRCFTQLKSKKDEENN